MYVYVYTCAGSGSVSDRRTRFLGSELCNHHIYVIIINTDNNPLNLKSKASNIETVNSIECLQVHTRFLPVSIQFNVYNASNACLQLDHDARSKCKQY